MLILYKSCYIQQAWSVTFKRWNMICNVKKLFCRKQQNDLWIVWIIRNYRKIHRCFFWVLWLTATLILGKQISSGQGESKSLAFSAVRVYLNYVCFCESNKHNLCIHVITQSKRKIFSSTCPSDKYYIKFGRLKPMISCPKHFAWNSKLKNNWALSTWILILGMSYVLT